MSTILLWAAVWVAGYVSGSVPSGLVVARLLHGIDIREHGSGNIGTANVYRTAGRRAALLTLLLDGLKGVVPVLLAWRLGLPLRALLLVGAAPILGHNWSLFLKGRGGKGIATSLGVLAVLAWPVAALATVVWAIAIALSRYASLASLLMMASVPALMLALDYARPYALFGAALFALALYRHRANLGRLWHGTELKISAGSLGHASHGK
ncbi:MAG: glycerol-3-phosphate 1-O-acyltransferase PlsY [Thermomicrobiaceae bacterium]|nr:glycerol-3-phosphate 1-O-acyltransferase PlsY [Thermomicrobiaceae bacterium]